jgi:hypothetical protein
MTNNYISWLIGLFIACFSMSVYAASDAEFPKGWDSWPVHHSGAIPDNKSPISADLPGIVQETFKTYNWVHDGKGSKYNIRVNPAQKDAAFARKGDIPDGSTGVLELTDINVLLVTEHLVGEPQYGAYSTDGKDVSGLHPSLNPGACQKCHSGYGEACVTGVCTH